MIADAGSHVGLWLAVVASGLYHGLNPAMGWPLAVSNALMARRARALVGALAMLALGHVLAILIVIVPFSMLAAVLAWRQTIQLGASVLVAGFGIALLVWRRHPRVLARIAPSRLVLWSFAVAIAHGAALMLVPVYLGLCEANAPHAAHLDPVRTLVGANLGMALVVSAVHVAAMIAAGGLLAAIVYRWLGVRFVSRSWFNLDGVWAASLVLVGALSLAFNLSAWPALSS